MRGNSHGSVSRSWKAHCSSIYRAHGYYPKVCSNRKKKWSLKMEFLCTDHSRLRYPRCIRVCKMAPIQKVLLRMLFQLELLTLLNLERDFDIVGPREEKRATKRRQERERERGDGKKEERFGYRFVVASRILNIIGAKKHELKGHLHPRQRVLNADQYLWTLPANAIFRKSESRWFGSATSVTSRTLKIIIVF